MASPSVYSESFLFGKRLVLANRLQLRPSNNVSGGLRRRTRFHRLPILLLHAPFLHPRTHSLPLSHSLLLSPPPLLPLRRFRAPPLPLPLFSMTTAPPPPPPSDSTKTDRVVIKGRVQGVFYRDWTVQNAAELGLKGWVRNRRDGSVEALFSGPPDKVQEMEQRCRSGPPAAAVTGFQVFPCSDDPGSGFERRPTV